VNVFGRYTSLTSRRQTVGLWSACFFAVSRRAKGRRATITHRTLELAGNSPCRSMRRHVIPNVRLSFLILALFSALLQLAFIHVVIISGGLFLSALRISRRWICHSVSFLWRQSNGLAVSARDAILPYYRSTRNRDTYRESNATIFWIY